MKALIYTGPNAVEFRDVEEPKPGPGEALVRVEAVGICGSDMHAYHGHDSRRPAPLVLGHEAAGTVLSGAFSGKRVAVNPLVVDPACEYARQGRSHLSPTRQIISMPPRPGALAEYICIPERNLVEIPESFDATKAALAEPMSVAYHAITLGLRQSARPAPALRCLVLGGGAIGLSAALTLKMLGAGSITIGETNAARRHGAEIAGAFRTFAPGSEDEPPDNSFDLVLDAVGAAATRALACRTVRPGGVIVHAGLIPGHDGLDVRKITLQEIMFTGCYCFTDSDFRETVAAIVGGRLGGLDWIERRPLSDGPRAFADIDAGRVGAAKIVLVP